MLPLKLGMPCPQHVPRSLELGVSEADARLLPDGLGKLALVADLVHVYAVGWGHVVDVVDLQPVRPLQLDVLQESLLRL